MTEGTSELDQNSSVPAGRIEKKINEEVRKMMSDLFSCLEGELTNFIGHFEKLDG